MKKRILNINLFQALLYTEVEILGLDALVDVNIDVQLLNKLCGWGKVMLTRFPPPITIKHKKKDTKKQWLVYRNIIHY